MEKTRSIDFATLPLVDALDLAILIEEEAEERYEEFAHQMKTHHNPEAESFFRFMAANEAKHGAQLHERRVRIFGATDHRVTRAMIFDVEAPDYDEVRAFMTPRQALEAALRAEEKAHAFFLGALPHVKTGDVHALFAELCEEEIEHQNLVKEQMTRLAPEAALTAEDVADEPAPQ